MWHMKMPTWKAFFLLSSSEAAIAFIALLLIPSDQKNSIILGYSTARLALMGFLFVAAITCCVLSFRSLKWLEENRFHSWFSVITKWGSILGLGAIVLPFIGGPYGITAYHFRLLPVLIWLTVISIQLALWLGARKYGLALHRVPAALMAEWFHLFHHEMPLKQDSSGWIRLAAGMALLAVLVPSTNYNLLNGLPLDNGLEILVLLVIGPVAFSRHIGSWFAGWICSFKNRLSIAGGCGKSMLALGCVAAILHVALYFSSTDTGFLACYTTSLRPPPRGKCEVFYQNPFHRYGISRIDREINFSDESWNLSFLNDADFNFYFWKPGNILRERTPFSVVWTGIIDLPNPSTLVLKYVGEGNIEIGGQVIDFAPAYYEEELVEIAAPQGENLVTIRYHYDDGYRTGGDPPYTLMPVFTANLKVGAEIKSLVTLPAEWEWRFLSFLADFCLLIVAGLILVFYFVLFRHDLWIFAILALSAAAIHMSGKENLFIALNTLIFLLLILRRKAGRTLGAAFLFIATGFLWTWFYLPTMDRVFIRIAGTDMLTYEGFARSILHTGSLQAGESIFYYQPLYRYIVFFAHLIFGDGDTVRTGLTLAMLLLGMWKLAEELVLACWRSLHLLPRVAIIFACVAMVALVNDRVVWLVVQGASETPTWVLLPWILWLVVRPHGKRNSLWIGVLLGISVLTRTNHLPAVIWLLLLYGLSTKSWKSAISSTVWSMALLLLAGLHNLYYGQEFILLPTSSGISANLVLPPMEALTGLNQIGIWQKMSSQASLLLGGVSHQFWVITLTMRALLVVWMTCVVWILYKRKINWFLFVALCFPWVYLGVQFFYDLPPGYPRHLMAGYVAMGCSVLMTLCFQQGTRREE